MVIPADAPHPSNAHKFINYILRPEVHAALTNKVFYANPNKESKKFIKPEVANNPTVFLARSEMKKMQAPDALTNDIRRPMTRTYTRFKTGLTDRQRRQADMPAPARTTALPADRDVVKDFGGHRGRQPRQPRHRQGRDLRAARLLGLRQDDAAAHARRLRDADLGPHPARWPGPGRPAALRAADEHDVPELRAVPAPDGVGQHRLRPEARRPAARPRSPSASRRCSSSCSSASSAKRKPHQLSGGQQQRVALARSLAKQPQLLLLDEPLGALDKKLREETQIELVNIIEEVGVTCVMVTHDQEEAMTMASRIAVMSEGRFLQVGAPAEIYETPATRFVADFIGNVNLMDGTLVEDEADHVRRSTAPTASTTSATASPAPQGMTVTVAVRPEKIHLSRARAEPEATPSGFNRAQRHGQGHGLLRQLHRLPPASWPAAACSRSARATPQRHREHELHLGRRGLGALVAPVAGGADAMKRACSAARRCSPGCARPHARSSACPTSGCWCSSCCRS